MHVAGNVNAKAVTKRGQEGLQIAVDGIGTAEGVAAGYRLRKHLLHAVHGQPAVFQKSICCRLEYRHE